MMKKVSLQGLGELFSGIKGAKMVSIVTETVPTLKAPKSNPLNGRLVKRSYVNCVVNFNYTNSVNNQRGREGNLEGFEALPRTWGVRIAGTPLVEHKGKVYLETKVEKVYNTEYVLDGSVVPPEEVYEFLAPRKPEGVRQEVEKPVILRDYALKSIRVVNMDSEQFVVE